MSAWEAMLLVLLVFFVAPAILIGWEEYRWLRYRQDLRAWERLRDWGSREHH